MNRGFQGVMALVTIVTAVGCRQEIGEPPAASITFNQHVAPILFAHCAPCHRPGQSAPFPLLTFRDAQKHSRTIVDVTAMRLMPPWLPAGRRGEFVGDRRLTETQIELLRRWVADGTEEGLPAGRPSPPQFPADWLLGKPDLVATLGEPFLVPAEGTNIYRNFVLPLPLKQRHYVRAVDIRPGSAAVHHALMAYDRAGNARKWDARDPEPGFSGFTLPSGLEGPPHFLSWSPGKQPDEAPPGLAWPLEAGVDWVLQLHLRPTGKPEPVAPQVAFYFTTEVPTNEALKFSLSTLKISIPAGASNHLVRSQFTLPAEAALLGVLPHAHFLAREINGTAHLPDGTQQAFLQIPNWDFNWQDSYRLAQPMTLPAGTVLRMEILYDNSANNSRNPHSPPQTVRYGLESEDEMASIAVQVLARDAQADRRIREAIRDDLARHNLDYNTYLLEKDPRNARAHLGLARAFYHFGELEKAAPHLATARQLDPRDEDAALLMGIVEQFRKRPEAARAAFEDCLRLNPNHARAHGCFAVLAMEQGWLELAHTHLHEALRINPADSAARNLLRQLEDSPGKPPR